MKSCIVHECPVKFAHWFPPVCCTLIVRNGEDLWTASKHMLSSHQTLSLGLHDGIFYCKTGNCKSSFEDIINILNCKCPSSLQLIDTLYQSGLVPTSISKILRKKRYSLDESLCQKQVMKQISLENTTSFTLH